LDLNFQESVYFFKISLILDSKKTISCIHVNCSIFSQSLNKIKVGILIILKLAVVKVLSSTLILKIFALFQILLDNSSIFGSIARHGQHHSAQKSTRQTHEDISFIKFASFVSNIKI
jgi:hypothetical protein